jgi:hypothetical protein
MTDVRWKHHHPIYGVWNAMKTRCNNVLRESAHRYIGRGISYCPRWESFENFCHDMLPTWKQGLILDRRDNDGDYTPDNCRWVTPTESSRNRRSNKLTFEDALEIRRLYATGYHTQRSLAKMFGTSQTNIHYTLHFKQWRDVA